MKHTMYFDTVADLERYFPDGVPSNVLAIVKDTGGLYTSSNNESSGGNSQEQGGEPISDEDREFVDWTLEGEPAPELEEGWYFYSDSGHYYQMEEDEGVYSLVVEDINWDFPGYFVWYDKTQDEEYPYFTPNGNITYWDLGDDLDPNADKYGENRIILGKDGELAGKIYVENEKGVFNAHFTPKVMAVKLLYNLEDGEDSKEGDLRYADTGLTFDSFALNSSRGECLIAEYDENGDLLATYGPVKGNKITTDGNTQFAANSNRFTTDGDFQITWFVVDKVLQGISI